MRSALERRRVKGALASAPTRVLACVLACVLGPITLATAAAPAEAQSAAGLLERAAERYAGLDALCADFQQRLQVPLLGQTTESRGRLCQRAPSFFRMDFSEPEGDEIVADGEHLWIYYPSTQPGQVVQTDLRGGGAVDFHREFLSEPNRRYVVEPEGSETVAGRRTERIRLTPRAAAPYTRATVWIDTDEALVRRIEIEQDGGSTRRIEMSDLTLNPDLADDFFRFAVPEGTHVVRMAGT